MTNATTPGLYAESAFSLQGVGRHHRFQPWSSKGVNVTLAPRLHGHRENTALLADPVHMEQLSARIPAGRWGQPQGIGNVVVFLASPAASTCTARSWRRRWRLATLTSRATYNENNDSPSEMDS